MPIPAFGFISALFKGGWWVSTPPGCVSIQKHLPLADGLLMMLELAILGF